MTTMKTAPLNQSELARLLGVSRGQVYMWHQRRDRNGFPDPVAYETRLGKQVPLYNWPAVRTWHASYAPSLGGRPAKKPQVKAS